MARLKAWSKPWAWAFGAVVLWLIWPRRMVWVYSPATGKKYRVRNLPGQQQVADRLATLETRMARFLTIGLQRFPNDPRLRRIRDRWTGTLAETDNDSNVAYSLGKSDLHVCVRGANGDIQSANACTFVLMHELAHVSTDSWGHPPEFWNNMRFLLELGETLGFYDYEDHGAKHTSFCGKDLGSSPLTCVKTGRCPSTLTGSD